MWAYALPGLDRRNPQLYLRKWQLKAPQLSSFHLYFKCFLYSKPRCHFNSTQTSAVDGKKQFKTNVRNKYKLYRLTAKISNFRLTRPSSYLYCCQLMQIIEKNNHTHLFVWLEGKKWIPNFCRVQMCELKDECCHFSITTTHTNTCTLTHTHSFTHTVTLTHTHTQVVCPNNITLP